MLTTLQEAYRLPVLFTTKNINMGPLGFNEILIILVILLLLFGAKKIPELMRGVGKGMREFNDAKSSTRRAMEDSISEINKPSYQGETLTETEYKQKL